MEKLFGTDGIRGIAGKYPLDDSTLSLIGEAIGKFAKNSGNTANLNPIILIGRDTRISGPEIEQKITSSLIAKGCRVKSTGVIPTPAIAYLTKKEKATLGIVISASHNPPEYNGIKIFNEKGLKLTEKEEEQIEKNMQSSHNKELHNKEMLQIMNIIQENDITEEYSAEEYSKKYIQNTISTLNTISTFKNLKGLKIILDCANGSAYKIGQEILKELEAQTIMMNDAGDGRAINEKSGALHPESAQARVLETSADIGIALDGDADRVILIDEKGTILDGDEILAMCAVQLKEEGKLNNNTIVATVMSNIGLSITLHEKEIKVIQTNVGDKYVVEEMLKSGSMLGGEQSGHIIFLEHGTTGDGLMTALQVMKIMKGKNKKLSELRQTMKKMPQTLLNISVQNKKEFTAMPKTSKAIKEAEQALGTKGRVLVRYSGTENKARVLAEGENAGQVQKLAETIAEAIKEETQKELGT